MHEWNVEVPAAKDGDDKICSTTVTVKAQKCAAGDGGDLTFWSVVNGSEVTVRIFARRTWLSCTMVTT